MKRLALILLTGLAVFVGGGLTASAADFPTDPRVTAAVAAWKTKPVYVDPLYAEYVGTQDQQLAERIATAPAPVFVAVAICIKVDSRGPVFFRQVRMGAGDRTFRVFKFRTMVVDAEQRKADVAHLNMHQNDDPRMFKIPNDPRVTRVGGFLRRSRIDELPQLLNVLSGEMSLVGPRPLILDEDRHVQRWARARLRLKPGMTGLWQVLGASDIPFDEMTKLDYVYVTNWSLREDLRLILLTLPALARARAAY